MIDELNEYDEEIHKIISVYAPHPGTDLIHETRTTKWRIVAKAVEAAVHPLNLISASGAPRSTVNNCGEVEAGAGQLLPATPSEYTAAVMNLIEIGAVSWNDPDVARVLREASKGQVSKVNYHQHTFSPSKARDFAPSARMTRHERERMPQVERDLSKSGITPARWELKALARGSTVTYGGQKFTYLVCDGWPGFLTN